MSDVRVRFAPSPTGGLHVGGLRTALYNYLFAKKNNGVFYVRIEDTDQKRFVDGAEEYIFEALEWLGITPDETIDTNEIYGPYKQSLRTELYNTHIQSLLDNNKAYYAFDTPDELQTLRDTVPFFRYDHTQRTHLNNSTNPLVDTVSNLLNGVPYTIRLLNIPGINIRINDEIRGLVQFNTEHLDDKILVKNDGLPTYHLASVIDDHYMKTSHVIRGEEWLPSLPIHVLLYDAFGWDMPKFAHLPLILKPNGNGKISKRDAIEGGFPILPLNWGETLKGYKECGYEPQAVINFLATSAWNNNDDKELYTIDELVNDFELKNINKAGSKYDIKKLDWYNNHYFQQIPHSGLFTEYKNHLSEFGISLNATTYILIMDLTKYRYSNKVEMFNGNMYLFIRPDSYDSKIMDLLDNHSLEHLYFLVDKVHLTKDNIKDAIYNYTITNSFKMKHIMQLLRYALVGSLSGIDVFDIIEVIGDEETRLRIDNLIKYV